ncbi:uncharacterized protein [Eurosta solidaginis]|uniref:uncharacterized protein n=1 Tax=Eurosta solidaginis TaxID=178769 RepID=UPI0035310911
MPIASHQLRILLGIALLWGEFTNSCFGVAASDHMSIANKREQLLTIMIEEYLKLTDYELEHCKVLVQNVLADQQVMDKQSDLMDAERLLLENFVRQVTDKEQEEAPAKTNIANRFFYLIAKSMIYQGFESILRRHDTTNSRRKFSPENYLIESSFKRNGLGTFQRDVTQKQMKFMNDFVKEVESYVSLLTPAQRNERDSEPQKMINWLVKMRRDTDVQQRMETFKDFMRFFVKM